MEFFNARDSCIFEVMSFAILVERRIHLARTEDDTLDVFRLIDSNTVPSFGEQWLEVGSLYELCNIRTCKGVAK